MRIVIDLQGAQGASRLRGIGRNTMSIALAIARNPGEHEIIIVLNGMFPETIEPIRAAFGPYLPQENIRVWQAVGPTDIRDPENTWRRNVAEILRENFLASLQPDIVYITSMFEGYGDDAIHSIGLTSHTFPTAVIVYDFIPLVQSEYYLKSNPSYEAFYYEKLKQLMNADLFLAISDSSREEAIKYLNAHPDNATSVSAAADPCFKKLNLTAQQVRQIREKFNLDRKFIMYSSATDDRKNHLRLINAYSMLPAELKKEYQLAIVGSIPPHNKNKFEQYAKFYGLEPDDLIITSTVTDDELVSLYNMCDLFVFPSWHEGFGLPVLEAMSCGAPVIASNTTSLPEVVGREDALFDPFDPSSISRKIVEVLTDESFRTSLIKHGLRHAETFTWDASAEKVLRAMEHFHENYQLDGHLDKYSGSPKEIKESIIDDISILAKGEFNSLDIVHVAKAIEINHGLIRQRQLMVDVSELALTDARTGIQRVVRSILLELVNNPPLGYEVVPVYALQDQSGYRYANKFLASFLSITPDQELEDDWVSVQNGDIFFGLDLTHAVMQMPDFYDNFRRMGGLVYFVVYDLLPVLLPEMFVPAMPPAHQQWLYSLSKNDGLICISKAVADELMSWLDVYGPKRYKPLKVDWFHLGADMTAAPSMGLPEDAEVLLDKLDTSLNFLVVGTVEPRKGLMQVIAAFDRLWMRGIKVNLVIVGKQGWNVDLLVEILNRHSESGKQLFWLQGISDEYLELIYAKATCLIAASEGEGFGLPLIEAAQKGIPIIARDIPVFREVAGSHAFYFSGNQPDALADCITNWLSLEVRPTSLDMPWLTWKQSTAALVDVILKKDWYREWVPDGAIRYWGGDVRLLTQVGERKAHDMLTTRKTGFLIYGPYFPLSAGHYEVSVYGAWEAKISDEVKIDVSYNRGTVTLFNKQFNQTTISKNLAKIQFSLTENCSDFEVRIWVDKQTTMKISLLEFISVESLTPIKYVEHKKAEPVETVESAGKRLSFSGVTPQLLTQVGLRQGKNILSTAKAGYLIYGPYLALGAGCYEVSIYGMWDSELSERVYVDVSCNKGRLKLFDQPFKTVTLSNSSARLQFELLQSCEDLEVRIRIDDQTTMQISLLEFMPIDQITSYIKNVKAEELPKSEVVHSNHSVVEHQNDQVVEQLTGEFKYSPNVKSELIANDNPQERVEPPPKKSFGDKFLDFFR